MAHGGQLLQVLKRHGLLLLQDKRLPSVVSIVTGESLSGSWWAHPKAQEIFRCLTELADHPDVLFVKLLAGKVTLVHRRLWPALLGAATSGEPWQWSGLSPDARRLAHRAERSRAFLASGPPVRELQRRLLLLAREEHGEDGAHRMVVEGWKSWAKRAGCPKALPPAEAKRGLERAAAGLGAAVTALPWGEAPLSAAKETRRPGPRGGRKSRRDSSA